MRLTWLQLIKFFLQLHHIVVELFLFFFLYVRVRKCFQIYLSRLVVFIIQLIKLFERIRWDLLVTACIEREFLCLTLFLCHLFF